MYVMKFKETAHIDYEFEVEIDDEDIHDIDAGTMLYSDLESKYKNEIRKAREEVDYNEWEAVRIPSDSESWIEEE